MKGGDFFGIEVLVLLGANLLNFLSGQSGSEAAFHVVRRAVRALIHGGNCEINNFLEAAIQRAGAHDVIIKPEEILHGFRAVRHGAEEIARAGLLLHFSRAGFGRVQLLLSSTA